MECSRSPKQGATSLPRVTVPFSVPHPYLGLLCPFQCHTLTSGHCPLFSATPLPRVTLQCHTLTSGHCALFSATPLPRVAVPSTVPHPYLGSLCPFQCHTLTSGRCALFSATPLPRVTVPFSISALITSPLIIMICGVLQAGVKGFRISNIFSSSGMTVFSSLVC